MEVEEAIKNRRSVRSYLDKPVEDEKIAQILEAARWAPSAGNLQCVEYIVVKNPETKKALCKASYGQEYIKEAPVCVIVCCNMDKISHYGQRGVDVYSIQESGAAVENMMLEAYALGLGTCWVGAFNEGEVRKILNIPKHVRPVAIITLGYPNEKPIGTRRELKDIVFFETYKGK